MDDCPKCGARLLGRRACDLCGWDERQPEADGDDPEEPELAEPIYLLCVGCGHFLGDVRLYPGQPAVCHRCGATPLLAFSDLERVREAQAEFGAGDS